MDRKFALVHPLFGRSLSLKPPDKALGGAPYIRPFSHFGIHWRALRGQMKKRILIIEDEPDYAFFLRRIMPEYETLVLSDPAIAVELATEFRPDLIILDLVMPGVRGEAVAEIIKQEPQCCNIPIIFVSALIDSRPADDRPVFHGEYHAFGKPFSVESLKKCIDQHISATQIIIPEHKGKSAGGSSPIADG
jgi:CheY-like chemotaxis protein